MKRVLSFKSRGGILLWGLSLAATISLLALGHQPVTARPFQSPPPSPLHRLQVAAWMPTSWDGERALVSFRAHAMRMDTISPYWYGLRADGTLNPLTGARDPAFLAQAHHAGVRVIPTISNQYNGQRVHTLLTDPTLAQAHQQAIVDEVLREGYDGIDLDYENLLAEDRDRYSAWIADLAGALHAHQRQLTVTVQPKTFDAAGWNGPGAQDYQALGQAADALRIMTYGWCWSTGCIGSPPPGPIAPIHWMEWVIDYAKTQVPASRLVLGIHLYGYDWPAASQQAFAFPQAHQPLAEDLRGNALVWEAANQLRLEHQAPLQWWETDDRGLVREPWFEYEPGHTVVFANARSVRTRVELAQRSGLRGIIFWRLGGEDPALWQALPPRVYRTFLPATLSAHP